jgi:hypothetical protein
MIKSPLECLKSQSNGFTDVVMLDSFAFASGVLESDKFWAHLLIEAWVALEGEQDLLGLCNEKPMMEELLGKLKFHRPKVRTTPSFTTFRLYSSFSHRCGSKETRLTVGFTSFRTFTLRCILGRKHRRSW